MSWGEALAVNLLFQDGHNRFQNGIKYVYEDGVPCKDTRIINLVLKDLENNESLC